jgi:hypothetical protein
MNGSNRLQAYRRAGQAPSTLGERDLWGIGQVRRRKIKQYKEVESTREAEPGPRSDAEGSGIGGRDKPLSLFGLFRSPSSSSLALSLFLLATKRSGSLRRRASRDQTWLT